MRADQSFSTSLFTFLLANKVRFSSREFLLLTISDEGWDILAVHNFEESFHGVFVDGDTGGLHEGFNFFLGYREGIKIKVKREVTYLGRSCLKGIRGNKQLGVSLFRRNISKNRFSNL